MQNAFEQKDTSNSLLSSYGFVSRDHPNSTPRLTGLSQSHKKKTSVHHHPNLYPTAVKPLKFKFFLVRNIFLVS
jgi:hypothetical protein